MKSFFLVFALFSIYACCANAQNTGIGTRTPTHKLTVNATTDPARFIGLQLQNAATVNTGTIVTDATGVLKRRTGATISAAKYTGSITLANNNTLYFNNATAPPTKVYDNLGEFDGKTFTPKQPGLYAVTFTVVYDQRTAAFDGGNGYLGYCYIYTGTPTNMFQFRPFDIACVALPKYNSDDSASVINDDLVRLSAGMVLQFEVKTTGSTGGVTANYDITIVRVD